MKKKINFFDTPQLRREKGTLYVNLMTNLTMPKVKIKKYERRKRHI